MKFITLSFICLFTGSLLNAQICSFKVSGHVHSTVTHENLSHATVVLEQTGKTIITDDNGDFRFDSLCSGNYSILITHAGYDTLRKQITLGQNSHLDFDLKPLNRVLTGIVVTGERTVARTGISTTLSGRALEETRGLSLSEALNKINGVSMLQTGSNVAKPVIHGLHSNRILTINNGVRQEGQQWGNEHAPEIDPFIANRLTVIKGVDELRYGSDAIGGVILVEPRALRTTPGYNAELNTIYATNNRQYVASAIFEQQLKKHPAFTYRLQGTFKKSANITTPHYRLNNTAMEEKNVSATAGWRKEHFNSELYYSLFNTQVGIFKGSHVGNISDLEDAINAERPASVYVGQNSYAIARPSQDVTHHLLKWKTGFDIKSGKINILLAGQYNNRKEYDIVRNADAKGAQINLSVYTLSQEVNWEHPKKNNLNGVIGAVAMQQDNSYGGRYLIPNYRSYSFGAYAIEKWSKDKWDLQAGLRFDHKDITTSRLQSASQTFTGYQFDFATLASSLNAGYKIIPQWQTNLSFSIATRAPHVNELLTNGIHHGSGTYEVGDIYLKPEHSLNIVLNNEYTSKNKVLSTELTLYRNSIQNFIYQQPKPGEPVLTIRGAFPKIVYQATDAILNGADFSLTVQPVEQLTYSTRFSIIRAKNKRIDDWLIGMPSDRITNELTYSISNRKKFTDTYFSIEVQNILKQTRVPDDKNEKQDYKAPPPGYTLVNANASTTFKINKLPVTLSITGHNLLNKAYRDYLNSFRYFTDEMGRNISLRLKIGLQHFY